MPECPIDECDYRADKRGSVVAHMSSKTDEAHSGIGFQKAEAMMDAKGGSTPDETNTSGNTLEVHTDDSEPSQDNSDDGHSCPECEADAGDVSQLEPGSIVQCTECGARLRWDP